MYRYAIEPGPGAPAPFERQAAEHVRRAEQLRKAWRDVRRIDPSYRRSTLAGNTGPDRCTARPGPRIAAPVLDVRRDLRRRSRYLPFSQRGREIGIRIALGAQARTVTTMFVRHGLVLSAIGVAIGLTVAFAIMQLMSSFLFEISPIDPLTYAVVSLTLMAATVLASYVPALRATAVDPIEALRAE